MKKIFLSILLVVGIILLAGCRKVDFSKTSHIVCKKTEYNTNDIHTSTLTFAYDKNEKIGDFGIEEYIKYNQPMSKEAIEITQKTMKLISKALGASFESEISDNSFKYSFTGNIKVFKALMKKLNDNSKEINVKGDTKEEALYELTKEGYTCKDIKK